MLRSYRRDNFAQLSEFESRVNKLHEAREFLLRENAYRVDRNKVAGNEMLSSTIPYS